MSYSLNLAPHALLLLGLAFAFLKQSKASLVGVAAALTTALALGELTPLGAAGLSFIGMVLYVHAVRPELTAKLTSGAIFIALATLISVHLLPGVLNPLVVPETRLSADSIPFKMYLNLDKPLIGLFLVLFIIPKAELKWRGQWTMPLLMGLVGFMMPLALALGYVRFDAKFPDFSLLWAFNNLFFVCVAEEGLFRGLIQGRWFARAPRFGLVIGAVLFGFAHFQGGWIYVILASLAGLVYGLTYHKSRSLTSAISVHFLFNAIHFFLFSYPALG